jgi:hypothetical protein
MAGSLEARSRLLEGFREYLRLPARPCCGTVVRPRHNKAGGDRATTGNHRGPRHGTVGRLCHNRGWDQFQRRK